MSEKVKIYYGLQRKNDFHILLQNISLFFQKFLKLIMKI